MRLRPKFDVLYKQSVRPEDMFLGMSGLDPSTAKCQDLLMKVQLPDTKIKEITLDIKEQRVLLQSPKFFLNHALPYKVHEKDCRAKWISDKYVLEITLPMNREKLMPDFY